MQGLAGAVVCVNLGCLLVNYPSFYVAKEDVFDRSALLAASRQEGVNTVQTISFNQSTYALHLHDELLNHQIVLENPGHNPLDPRKSYIVASYEDSALRVHFWPDPKLQHHDARLVHHDTSGFAVEPYPGLDYFRNDFYIWVLKPKAQ